VTDLEKMKQDISEVDQKLKDLEEAKNKKKPSTLPNKHVRIVSSYDRVEKQKARQRFLFPPPPAPIKPPTPKAPPAPPVAPAPVGALPPAAGAATPAPAAGAATPAPAAGAPPAAPGALPALPPLPPIAPVPAI